MKAKEMFRKLGYKLVIKNKKELIYKIIIKIDDWETETKEIYFWIDDKQIALDGDYNLQELKAIVQQCEELEWNKEEK